MRRVANLRRRTLLPLAAAVALAAAPVATAAAATAKVVPHTQTGLATYYPAPANRHIDAAHMCASPSLPFGTHVTITDLQTHHSLICVVWDRQGRIPGHVIDLNLPVFARLAPLSQGVIPVKLSW